MLAGILGGSKRLPLLLTRFARFLSSETRERKHHVVAQLRPHLTDRYRVCNRDIYTAFKYYL
ncbi:hypothetical protein ACJEM9_25060, partial [Escherichia coli]